MKHVRQKVKKCQYAREQYRNLSQEEKEKKCQYGCEQYKILGDEDEYKKNFLECNKKKIPDYKTFFILSTLGCSIEYRFFFLRKS